MLACQTAILTNEEKAPLCHLCASGTDKEQDQNNAIGISYSVSGVVSLTLEYEINILPR